MTIKGFHIFFISLATLLCVLVAMWAFVLEDYTSLGLRVLGAICAVAAISLPIYGFRFYRKVQTI